MHRGRRGLLLLLVLVLVAGGVGIAQATTNPSEPAPVLRVSNTPTRDEPLDLAGAEVSRSIYVFLSADTSVRRVAFYLDRSTTDPASVVETIAPFDLAGTDQDTGQARPLSTLDVGNGPHTVVAVAERDRRAPMVAVARFNVANQVGADETASLFVSSHPDRSDPRPLDGTTVAGDTYVYVDPDQRVQRAEFYLDRSTNQSPTRIEQHPPFDLGATNQKTLLALPMRAAELGVGLQTLIVLVSLDTGDRTVLSARFASAPAPPPPPSTTPPPPSSSAPPSTATTTKPATTTTKPNTTTTTKPATTTTKPNTTTSTPPAPTTTVPTTTTTRPSTGGRTVGQVFGGFSQGLSWTYRSDSDMARELDEMRAIGVSWLRADVPWSTAQPNGRGTPFNWAQSDRWVRAALARGFKVLPILYFTPAWARPPGTSDKYPAANIDDWAAYISAAVAHYSALGVGQFEIWNEPNLDGFFGTAVSPEQYTNLLKVAYTAAKAVNPNAFIVSAGLAPAGDVCNASSCRPKYFLDRMYKAGAKGYFDAFGIHPYYSPQPVDTTSVGDWNTWANITQFRTIMAQYGDDKPIWATELGAATFNGGVSDAVQALDATLYYQMAASRPSWQGPLFWYSYRDYGTDPNDREKSFGVIRQDWSHKPSYDTMKQALAQPLP